MSCVSWKPAPATAVAEVPLESVVPAEETFITKCCWAGTVCATATVHPRLSAATAKANEIGAMYDELEPRVTALAQAIENGEAAATAEAIQSAPAQANIYLSRAQLTIALEALDDAAGRFAHMAPARDLRQTLRDAVEALDKFEEP